MTSTRHGDVLRGLQALFISGTTSGLTDSQLLQRFITGDDGEAFAALVVRHGPTVLAVCRGVLRDLHDAEDAFQATFLILARKARTIRAGESAGAWLYRVAQRVAVQANVEAGRRALHERQASDLEAREFGREGPWDDLLPRLHEEIGRLPEKYRAPIVLCDLGSLSRDQAAGQLGWPPGTVAGRLARGRDLLRARLIRRGVAPACVAIGMTYAAKAARASVPPSWESKAVEVASRIGASPTTSGGTISAVAWTLAQKTLVTMIRSQVRRVAVLGLTFGTALTGLFAALSLALADPRPQATVTVSGTVVDSEGRSAADVDIVLAEGAPPAVMSPSAILDFEPAAPASPAVIESGRSDANGGFRVELPVKGTESEGRYRPFTFWAYRQGSGLALRTIPDDWPPDGALAKLKLGRSASVAYRVVGPDGRPVVGAEMTPAVVRGKPVPRVLADRMVSKTDVDGRGNLVADSPGDLELIRVVAGRLGIQQVRTDHTDAGAVRTLVLSPAGAVEGQLKADDPGAVRNVPIRLRTILDQGASETGIGGLAETMTDDQGRFRVPAIAVGSLGVSFRPHPELPFRGRFDQHPAVEPGMTTHVEIPLRRAVLVRGLVRERGTGTPIAGVRVIVERNYDVPFATTDAHGKYSGYLTPGSVYVSAYPLKPYIVPSTSVDQHLIPVDVREFLFRPIELVRGTTLEGRVVDMEGRVVPEADVRALWAQGQWGTHAVTNREGVFRLEGADPRGEVRLWAQRGEARTAAPVSASAGKGVVTLTISPANSIALAGRALGSDGSPFAGATVRIDSRRSEPNRSSTDFRRLTFDEEGRDTLTTDSDGRFRTPRRFSPDLDYRVVVEAEGRILGRSPWIEATKVTTFPDVMLAPMPTTHDVEGRVVDNAGRPISGAVVFQSGDGPAQTKTLTDTQGRFRLAGVFREPAFLFVEGEGVRFAGHPIGAADEPVVLTVHRAEDPADPPMRALPPTLSRAEEKALALRLIEPDLAILAKEPNVRDAYVLLRVLSLIDPARAQDWVQRIDVSKNDSPRLNDSLRLNVAFGLFEESPERAAAVAESISGIYKKSYFYFCASDAVSDADRARKLALLETALRHARSEAEDSRRLAEFGLIGYRYLDLGERERGTGILEEGRRLAESLLKASDPRTGRTLAEFAAKLARIDGPAAVAIASGLASPEDSRGFAGIALGLADRDPKEAESALDRMPSKEWREDIVGRVAGRMAAKDAERARRIVDALSNPVWRARGLALMARGLAASDPKKAIGLVDESLDLLLHLSREGAIPDHPGRIIASAVAFSLLPVAEGLDPSLLRRSFWKVAALRPVRPVGGDTGGRAPNGDAEMITGRIALALARYDRDVARRILEPLSRRARSVANNDRLEYRHPLFLAAAQIDPTWALALIETLPDDPPGAKIRPKSQVRRMVADMLVGEDANPWNRRALKYFDDRGDSKDEEP